MGLGLALTSFNPLYKQHIEDREIMDKYINVNTYEYVSNP
jgi:hypothetical protein